MLARNRYHRELHWASEIGISGFSPTYSTPIGAMINADSCKVLKSIPSCSVDLVLTSPPFRAYEEKRIRQRTNRAISRLVYALLSRNKARRKTNGEFGSRHWWSVDSWRPSEKYISL